MGQTAFSSSQSATSTRRYLVSNSGIFIMRWVGKMSRRLRFSASTRRRNQRRRKKYVRLLPIYTHLLTGGRMNMANGRWKDRRQSWSQSPLLHIAAHGKAAQKTYVLSPARTRRWSNLSLMITTTIMFSGGSRALLDERSRYSIRCDLQPRNVCFKQAKQHCFS